MSESLSEFDDSDLDLNESDISGNFDTKCGEVLLSADGKFTISCDSCHKKYDEINSFTNHILNDHLNPDPDSSENIIREDIIEDITNDNSENEIINDNSLDEFVDEHEIIGNTINEIEVEILQTTQSINNENKTTVTNVETNSEKYSCSFCGRKYRQKTVWLAHEYKHLTTNMPCDKMYTCTFLNCKKTFNKKHNLDLHFGTHSTDRNFKCERCAKLFKTKFNLIAHEKRHKGIKRFTCDYQYCEKKFYNRSEMLIHYRIHNNERPYQCEICGQSFITSTKLKNHIKRHNNQRDWKCNECGRKFFDSATLKIHLITHSDNPERFACDTCSASFTTKGILRTHKKLHLNQKQYSCDSCSKRFAQRAGLYFHMKRCTPK